MPQKTKSILYLSCFVIAAILYYNTYASSSQNRKIKMVNTYHTHHPDNITILSLDDN